MPKMQRFLNGAFFIDIFVQYNLLCIYLFHETGSSKILAFTDPVLKQFDC